MKRLFALGIAVVFALVGITALAEEAEAIKLDIVEAVAIAETLPEGQTVTGVRIEYPGAVVAGTVKTGDYMVYGYDIIGLYVNDTGAVNEAAAEGKYVFLKLAYSTVPGYGMGKTLQYTGGINHRRDIHLDIRQQVDVTLKDESIVGANGFSNAGEINVLVDDFLAITFENPADGTILNYRLYIPAGYEAKDDAQEKIPLVVFLHGAGESGDNNASQIMGNPSALEFAYAEAQAENPCFVLAPQKPSDVDHGWAEDTGTEAEPFYTTSFALENVKLVIDQLLADYSIDGARLYCTGLSMGSRGTFALNMAYPDMFAAMLCIASCDIYTDEQLEGIKDKPMWVILAADETEERITNMGGVVEQLESLGATAVKRTDAEAWDGYARGYAAEQFAAEQLAAAEEAGASLLFTHYLPGTVIPSSHWSWVATYNNHAVRDWMFSQSLETAYAPAE